jgi:toxin ParE1/3/4
MNLELRPLAKDDLRQAFGWYEERRPGLGESFLASVESALLTIQQFPKIHPRVASTVRRASLSGFPFGIFYRADEDTIFVLAILHNARNPEHWKRRS